MDRLEVSLGTKLLERSARGLQLTDAGRTLLEHCQAITTSTDEAIAAISQHNITPHGLLRISAPFAFVHLFLSDVIPDFLNHYPEVTASLEIDNHRVDILRDGFDVAIRIGVLEDSSLVARRLGGSDLCVYAAPSYIERHGVPAHPEDLASHKVVGIRVRSEEHRWELQDAAARKKVVSVKARFCVNDPIMLTASAVRGIGVALIPSFLAEREVRKGKLVRILEGWHQVGNDYYVVFAHRRTTPKTRAFVDFLIREMAKSQPWKSD